MQICASIDVISPRFVIPVDIYFIPDVCVEPCDAYVSITFLNNSDAVKTFTPGVILDGVLTTFAAVTLASGGGIILSYDIKGLKQGSHSIEPFPNGEGWIQEVYVYPPYRG